MASIKIHKASILQSLDATWLLEFTLLVWGGNGCSTKQSIGTEAEQCYKHSFSLLHHKLWSTLAAMKVEETEWNDHFKCFGLKWSFKSQSSLGCGSHHAYLFSKFPDFKCSLFQNQQKIVKFVKLSNLLTVYLTVLSLVYFDSLSSDHSDDFYDVHFERIPSDVKIVRSQSSAKRRDSYSSDDVDYEWKF